MFSVERKILVVDDMMTVRKIVSKSLRNMGFNNIVEAVNGKDAFEKLVEMSQDCEFIISDWNMPVMTGIEFLKKMRQEQSTQNIPFIFLTAESDISQVTQGLDAGADNYLLKPFSANDLKTKIQQTYDKITAKAAA